MLNIITRKNKSNKKYYFLYILTNIILIVLLTSHYYTNNIYTSTIKNKLQNRVLTIGCSTENISSLNKISHITSVSKYYPSTIMFDTNNNKYILNYYNLNFAKINTSNLSSNQVIVSNDIKSNSIILYLNNEKYIFKVVGKHDNKYLNTNEIIVSEEFMKKLNKGLPKNEFNIIVDDYNNINYVSKELSKNNCEVLIQNDSNQQNIKMYNLILKVFLIGEVLIILLIINTLTLLTKDLINTNSKDIALLKIYGFHNSKILKILVSSLSKENIKNSLLIYIILSIVYTFLTKFQLISKAYLNYLEFMVIILLIIILISILLIIICILRLRKLNQKSIISLLKENQ